MLKNNLDKKDKLNFALFLKYLKKYYLISYLYTTTCLVELKNNAKSSFLQK